MHYWEFLPTVGQAQGGQDRTQGPLLGNSPTNGKYTEQMQVYKNVEFFYTLHQDWGSSLKWKWTHRPSAKSTTVQVSTGACLQMHHGENTHQAARKTGYKVHQAETVQQMFLRHNLCHKVHNSVTWSHTHLHPFFSHTHTFLDLQLRSRNVDLVYFFLIQKKGNLLLSSFPSLNFLKWNLKSTS